MKKISYSKMADVVSAKRKEKKLTQAQLADMTGIHRACLLYTSPSPRDRG